MKRITLLSLFVVLALALSSCSMHLGLSKIFGGGSSSSTSSGGNGGKHVKATHTPPSPPSSSGATGSQTPAAPANGSVMITSSGFQPNPLTVKAGTTVTWTNNDTAAESVTSDTAGLFDSGSLAAGATYKFTFSQAGTFTYHSSTNPALKGTVVVTP